MSAHQNRRVWQRHVLAENRRSIEGLLETLCDNPVYKIMATNEKYEGKRKSPISIAVCLKVCPRRGSN
jgi:hypothetical protein